MTYLEFLFILPIMLTRRYTSARRIDSVIDLEKLRSGAKSCLERDSSQFLDLTYLTEDLHAMLSKAAQQRSIVAPEFDNQRAFRRPDGVDDEVRVAAVMIGKSQGC